MARLKSLWLILPLLSGCSGASLASHTSTSDVACIGQLYDLPGRTEPFQVAAAFCAPHRPLDLSGARYYQTLASTLNIPYVSHDKPGSDVIYLTGSRIAQPTDVPAPPELSIN